jgi:hypothetical protein
MYCEGAYRTRLFVPYSEVLILKRASSDEQKIAEVRLPTKSKTDIGTCCEIQDVYDDVLCQGVKRSTCSVRACFVLLLLIRVFRGLFSRSILNGWNSFSEDFSKLGSIRYYFARKDCGSLGSLHA